MTARMSADFLKENLSNPARAYLWEALIPDPVSGDSETLLLRCLTSVLPGRSVGEILVPFKQSAGVKYPGKLQYPHTIDLTFIEGEDRVIFAALYGWLQAIVHDKTNLGTGDSAIKRDIYLNLLNTDGEMPLSIKLVGCYCQAIPDTPLDMSSEEELKYTATFSYDRWEEG